MFELIDPAKSPISYSRISTFQKCKRKYYYTYGMDIELNTLNIPFLIGKVIHYGVGLIFEKQEKPITKTIKYFDDKVNELREDMSLSADIEQELVKQRIIVQGMLKAYIRRHKTFIAEAKLISNEAEVIINMSNITGNDVDFIIILDNILEINKKRYLHELKTSASISLDYVNNIKTDVQTNTYFRLYNESNPKNKLSGIIYDVIKKPGIKLTKKETLKEYLKRLENWYLDKQDVEVFYQETFTKPRFSKKELYEGFLAPVLDDMAYCGNDKNKLYGNYSQCNVYGQCSFYRLCHGGENKINFMSYKKRKRD